MSKTGTRKQNTKTVKIKFEHRLVLANWMLDLFSVATFVSFREGCMK